MVFIPLPKGLDFGGKFGYSRGIMENCEKKSWEKPWRPRRQKVGWRAAEEYFKVVRDPKMAVTLPRVRFLELEEEPSR